MDCIDVIELIIITIVVSAVGIWWECKRK